MFETRHEPHRLQVELRYTFWAEGAHKRPPLEYAHSMRIRSAHGAVLSRKPKAGLPPDTARWLKLPPG